MRYLRINWQLLVFLLAIAFYPGIVNADYLTGLIAYERGDYSTALREWQPLAEQGNVLAQSELGFMFAHGQGVPRDYTQAAKWLHMAAEQGSALAQYDLGVMYAEGQGVPQDYSQAAKWCQMAAQQGHTGAQALLGLSYDKGKGVPQDYLLAYFWLNLAASKGERETIEVRDRVANSLTPSQLAQAQEMARNWHPKTWAELKGETMRASEDSTQVNEKPRIPQKNNSPQPEEKPKVPEEAPKKPKHSESSATRSGTGFLVNDLGFILTNYHVVEGCTKIAAYLGNEIKTCTPIKADEQNDLVLLKIEVRTAECAVFREGKNIRAGDTILTIGYPLRGLLAEEANVTTGTISALAGIEGDTRFIQITAPVQPGSSGGPLLDSSGNVVGVIVGKLDAVKVSNMTGDIPQNVNFAISESVVRAFLDESGVRYQTASPNQEMNAADIGEHAKKYTLVIEGWK